MPMWIVNNIKILFYDRINVSEEIDVNKTSESKECDVCHYWYFLNKGLDVMDGMIYINDANEP